MSNFELSSEDQAKYVELMRRAATDVEFRQLCLTDPGQAIESFGIPAPTEGAVRFYEPEDTVVQLPPVQAGAELSDEDLQQAAGGCLGSSCKKTEIGCPGSLKISHELA